MGMAVVVVLLLARVHEATVGSRRASRPSALRTKQTPADEHERITRGVQETDDLGAIAIQDRAGAQYAAHPSTNVQHGGNDCACWPAMRALVSMLVGQAMAGGSGLRF